MSSRGHGLLPPYGAIGRGAVHQGRLSVASRLGGRWPVQGWMAARSLATLERWYQPPVDPAAELHAAEHSRWSQNGEDGLLAALLDKVGAPDRTFVEIGAADGTENCTRALAEHGWRGVWIEADPGRARAARRVAAGLEVAVVESTVTSRNVAGVLRRAAVPVDPGVIVVDVDGSDLWVLRAALRHHRPRVVVVEYNATFPPGVSWSRRNRASYEWDETYRHGASLDALAWAAGRRGYCLVACDSAGVNALFVRADLVGPAGLAEQRIEDAYRPLVLAPPVVGHPWRAERPCPELSPPELERVRVASAGVAFRRPAHAPGHVLVGVRAVIENGTDRHLTSSGATPLRLSAHVLDRDGRVVAFDADRSWLHGGVPPHGRGSVAGLFELGADAHTLRLCLVQEGVAWLEQGGFDLALG
jgi:hypothetical protein